MKEKWYNIRVGQEKGGTLLSHLTQKAIVETTMRLVEQKTVKKITIRDIVEACGITRNTFYYYFHDIYEVLEHALAEGFERIGTRSESFADFLGSAFAFCVQYQRVLYNLYNSVGYEALADYLKKQMRPHLMCYLQNTRRGEQDEKLICVLYEEALVGTLMRWVCDPRRETDPQIMKQAEERIRFYFIDSLNSTITDQQIKEEKSYEPTK